MDLWDADAFAALHVDREMRDRTETPLRAVLIDAARQLTILNPVLESLGSALVQAAGELEFPEVKPSELPDDQAKVGESSPPPVGKAARIGAVLGALGRKVGDTVYSASEGLNLTVRDRAGLHDRQREAAGRRVAQGWMGETGTPRPVLSQIALLIDEVAGQARITT